MTVAELIEILTQFPSDLPVKIAKEVDRFGGEYDYYSPVLAQHYGKARLLTFVSLGEW